MKQIDDFRAWFSVVLGSIYGIIIIYTDEVVRTSMPLHITSLLLFVLLYFLVRISLGFLDCIVDSSALLRKWILRQYFIEGSWVDNAVFPDLEGFYSTALLNFKYTSEQLEVHANVLSCQENSGLIRAQFHGGPVTIEGKNTISFPYVTITRNTNEQPHETRGYEKLYLSSPGTYPEEYMGSFFNAFTPSIAQVEGRKIIKPEELEKISTAEGRWKFLEEELQKIVANAKST